MAWREAVVADELAVPPLELGGLHPPQRCVAPDGNDSEVALRLVALKRVRRDPVAHEFEPRVDEFADRMIVVGRDARWRAAGHLCHERRECFARLLLGAVKGARVLSLPSRLRITASANAQLPRVHAARSQAPSAVSSSLGHRERAYATSPAN